MKRDQFLKRLNARAGTRYDVTITRPTLESWVKEDFFEGVAPGSHRWTCKSYRTALQVCRLRSRGIYNADETRVHLWIHGADIPLDRLKGSALKLLHRFRAKLKRETSTGYDPRRNSAATGQTKRGFEISASKASPEIRPEGFAWSGDSIRRAFGLLHFGNSIEDATDLATPLLKRVGLESTELARFVSDSVREAFAGLLAEPKETCGSLENRIQDGSLDQFIAARNDFRLAQTAMRNARVLAKAAPPELGKVIDGLGAPAARISQAVSGADWGSGLFLLLLNQQLPRRAK